MTSNNHNIGLASGYLRRENKKFLHYWYVNRNQKSRRNTVLLDKMEGGKVGEGDTHVPGLYTI